MSTRYKACPSCNNVEPFSAVRCQQCGHAFRAILPRTDRTQLVASMPPSGSLDSAATAPMAPDPATMVNYGAAQPGTGAMGIPPAAPASSAPVGTTNSQFGYSPMGSTAAASQPNAFPGRQTPIQR